MRLSANEVAEFSNAAALLVTPLEHPTVDGWRAAVNRALKALLRSDSAGFLLPGADGPLLFSEEHDPAELARYPDFHPPPLPDGRSIWARLIEARVSTMASAYGRDFGLYTGSAYYNDYAAPNGARQTLCAMLPLGGADPRHAASVQVWRAARRSGHFEERDRQLLGMLFPAITVGVEFVVRWHRHRDQLGQVLDALGQAVRVFDPAGRVVHQTGAMTATLAADPEAPVLDAALLQAVRSAASLAFGARGGVALATSAPAREIRTRTARYRIRACLQHGTRPLVLATLERLTQSVPQPETLRRSFALTPAEARVALLLAKGRSNREIAERLAISPFTVRRHTEKVLQKLGVRTRAEVAARLVGTD